MSSEFHDEWYHHPLIEGFFLLIVKLMRFITLPYVMPIWVFLLTYFIGGMSILYCILIAAACGVIGYKVWVQAENEAVEQKEEEETNLE